MSELSIWEFVLRELNRGNRVGLMVVVNSEGSSPGRKGFKMAVAVDGGMVGSIGGGIMEHKLVEYVRDRLAANARFWELRKQVHSKDVPRDQSGMICSGTQWNAMVCLGPDMLDLVDEMVEALRLGNRVLFHLSDRGMEAAPLARTDLRGDSVSLAQGQWRYVEALGTRDVVHVIGGGHVGLAMCEVMSLLDFHVVNYDDRPGLNTMATNAYADEKVVIPYSQLGSLIEGSEDAYVIVMTFGYRGDDEAIRALLGRKYAYLGMMGSETKVAKLLHDLAEDGFPADQIAEIRTPAGLTLHCTTPMEIAVSIAAEIVDTRNKRRVRK